MPYPDPTRPAVLHLDLDAFFAAVEQRDKPSLRGKPVVVGGVGGRGVVATASYEARVFGIGSAMPTGQARRLCPNAAYLGGRFDAYRPVSEQVMALARELSPLVEPVSMDEAYVDLGGREDGGPLDVDGVTEIAERFRADVRARTGLTVSVGAGGSKLVAKIASDLRKPDALVVVPPAEQAELLAPLSVKKIPGVGAVSAQQLARHGFHTIGQLAVAGEQELVRLLGRAHGGGLWALSRGIDPRPVISTREAKSVSAESTFGMDLTDRRDLEHRLGRLSERVAARLVEQGLAGRTVTIKVRRYDFQTLNRSRTLQHATSSAKEVGGHARELLRAIDLAGGVRLLGVGVSGLTEYAQADLLSADDVEPVLDPDLPEEPEEPVRDDAEEWRPGQDVCHDEHGPGWVQGSGAGRVTVRFEGPHTPVGRIRTFADDDPALRPAGPPEYLPQGDPAPG
ncbi:DNA polymerase IV [Auraticoccus monumenti]|uniref:DNA polymerase IV n=1 Tax=Auraticoccus monumenti TaxID=675864 RepID=UPI000B8546B3|nr:DNA polymerase IV [Auraticoccus monumenti]